jgi:hypothetical protein
MELSPSWEAAFYGTRRFITVFMRALHWSPSWARSIQSIPPHPISLRSSLILSTNLRLGLPGGRFPSGFPTNILYAFLSPHSCYMPCPSHPPWLDLLLLKIALRFSILFLRYIFDLGFPRGHGRQWMLCLFKKGNSALSTNYKPVIILSYISYICESIIHHQLSLYFKFKLYTPYHGFIRSKSTVSNL